MDLGVVTQKGLQGFGLLVKTSSVFAAFIVVKKWVPCEACNNYYIVLETEEKSIVVTERLADGSLSLGQKAKQATYQRLPSRDSYKQPTSWEDTDFYLFPMNRSGSTKETEIRPAKMQKTAEVLEGKPSELGRSQLLGETPLYR